MPRSWLIWTIADAVETLLALVLLFFLAAPVWALAYISYEIYTSIFQ